MIGEGEIFLLFLFYNRRNIEYYNSIFLESINFAKKKNEILNQYS